MALYRCLGLVFSVSLWFVAYLILFFSKCRAHEAVLHAASGVQSDRRRGTPATLSSPDWTIYHRTSELLSEIKNMNGNCAGVEMQVEVMEDTYSAGKGVGERGSVSEGMQYVTIRHNDNGIVKRARERWRTRMVVMIVFGERGREMIGSEIAYKLISSLCRRDESGNRNEVWEAFSGLKDNVEFVIVPVVNVAGRQLVEMGRRCDMTNANDVDLVRNWDSHWDDEGSYGTFEGREDLRGKASSASSGVRPFSEPEARALRDIARKFKPTAYLSIRSGGLSMMPPLDCDRDVLPMETEMRFYHVLQRVAASFCAECKLGNRGKLRKLPLCGTGIDYMFSRQNVPFSFTWEVYEDAGASKNDCFRYYNPKSRELYDRTVHNWALAIIDLAKALQRWITIEKLRGEEAAARDAHWFAERAREAQKIAQLREAYTQKQGKSRLHNLGQKAKKIQLWPRENFAEHNGTESSFGREDALVFLGLVAGACSLALVMFLLRGNLIHPKIRKSRLYTSSPLKWA